VSVYLCVQILSALPRRSISGCSSGIFIVSPSQWPKPCQITIPMVQGLLMLDAVTWSSHDNCATTCHEGHLIGHPPHWKTWALGFQPSFHAILVSYALLMCLSGSRTVGPTSSLIPRLEAGYMHPCILSLAPSPIPSCRQPP